RRPWVQFDRKVEGQPYGGRPDGAAVDVEGNYWVAMYEGACVLQLSPAGDVLQRIDVPVQCPTMVCFGGPDLRTLFITSARKGRPAGEQEAEIPAGSLLSTRVEVAGLPVNFFKG
ncbi:SMP-30/gluconolactonase/LRE family protein, partial [Acidovorax sp.]|uniref:SMP-30/gluconolactonase/LRE family protein n=1 Tax=Acidovorax sp. TaxID=1872122 RepID=UPI0025BBDF65